jgi:hypothetical protein
VVPPPEGVVVGGAGVVVGGAGVVGTRGSIAFLFERKKGNDGYYTMFKNKHIHV